MAAAATTTAMEEKCGGVLHGKYELGRLLGSGTFAKVYHARHMESGRSVAMKVVGKEKVIKVGMMEQVKREISVMKMVHHPNIVELHEVMASKTKIYFAMELVRGGELFSKIARGRLHEDASRGYFQQLISAIDFCHSRGVYHRDLKPENLLLDENENLKVSDFGLSALTDQIHADGLLHTLCGTPAYVAPEILAKRGYDGAKIDVWSCGVILFVLAAGYLPFNDPNLMNMYRKIYKGEFRCPKWMSPGLKRLLSRLLDTNPKTRITMEEVKRDPWFRKGIKNAMLQEIDYCRAAAEAEAEGEKPVDLNAFDIISFSSGLDLSGMFQENHKSFEDVERLTVEEAPEKVMERVVEAAKAEEGRVNLRQKKEWGVEIEGQNGNFLVGMEVYRLTDRYAVLEVKTNAGEARVQSNLWKDKIRSLLLQQPCVPVVSC